MTWRDESAALARELAALASDGATVPMSKVRLQNAMVPRRQLLSHLQRVLADVRPRHFEVRDPASPLPAEPVTVARLQSDPVAALQRALRVHPAPRGWTNTDGPVERPGSAATSGAAGWAAVGRRTLLAEVAWSDVPVDRLTGAERWSVVADVAAFSRVVCVLDNDLAVATRRYGEGGRTVPQSLDTAPRSGLWFAATETAELAAAGWLPDWTVAGEHPDRHLPMAVQSPLELPAAQRRLRVLIDAAPSLSPPQVVLVATSQARLLAGAAAVLRDADRDPERAAWAWQLSRRIGRAVGEGHELASRFREPYDFPGMQARASARCMADTVRGGRVGGREWAAVAAAVERVPAVLGALARQAGRAWRSGDWLVPDSDRAGGGAPREWRKVRDLDAEPHLSTQLSALAAHAVASAGTRSALPAAVRGQGPALPPPREQLSGLRRTMVRPIEPSPHGSGRE